MKQNTNAANVEAGDMVTVNFTGGYPRAEQTLSGEVVAVSSDAVVIRTDLGRVFHEVTDGMVRSAKSRDKLGTRHGRTRGEFTGMEVTA